MTGARWEAGRFGIPATDVRLRLGSLMQLHIGRRAVALHSGACRARGRGNWRLRAIGAGLAGEGRRELRWAGRARLEGRGLVGARVVPVNAS